DWQGAETELKRSIEINPNFARGHTWYALYLALLGRLEEAFREIRIAKLLDPLSAVIKSVEGSVLCLSRSFEAAIEHFRQMLKEDAEFSTARVLLGLALEATGQYMPAFDQYQESMKGQGELPELVALSGRANALEGKIEDAQKAIQRLKCWPVDRM